MILEIAKSGYQNKNKVYTNPNRAYSRITNLNFFNPSKGWSSGPTALWLAASHKFLEIFILGFDFKGLEDGKAFNNIFADSPNYKKSTDGPTFFGNWLRQTKSVIQENPNIKFTRVIAPNNFCPSELVTLKNLQTIYIENFKKHFNLQ